MSWNQPRLAEPRAQPAIAAWLGWLVPGLGHLYVGVPLLGLIVFLVVFGLLLLGVRISDGLVFAFLDVDLRGPIAGALTPEAGNVAGLIGFMKLQGFGPPVPVAWPEHIHLGSWLMASSGMLNIVFTVHAVALARLPRGARLPGGAPAVQVLCGWLVPGMGHWLQGRRLRAVLVFGVLVGLLVLGSWLAEGSNLDRERHFYYWSGQFLAGLPVMVLEALHGHARVTHDIQYADAGLVFGCLAGLLNVLCLLDVQSFGMRRVLESSTSVGPERIESVGVGA